MTRVVTAPSLLVTALVVALGVPLGALLVAPPASAATSSVTYIAGLSDPQTAPLGTDSTCTPGTGPATPFRVVRFTVSQGGSYTVSDVSAPNDGRIGIYSGAFSPASVGTGCVSFVDTTQDVTLAAGTVYTMAQSTAPGAGGTGSFGFSFDGPGTVTVLTSTATTLTSSPATSELSKAATLTATVAGGSPTGTVRFSEGATVLGDVPLVGGVARLSVASLGLGNHTLTATYGGDAAHEGSAGVVVHRVEPGAKPKVKLSVSDKTPYLGQKVTLKWVVTGADKIRAGGGWKGKLPKSGSRKVTVKRLGFHLFKIRASNINGGDQAKVKVVVSRAPKQLVVSLENPYVGAATKVRVTATGLEAKERYKVFLDDTLLGKGFAGKKGVVDALLAIPKDAKEGEHELLVMGSNEGRVGTVEVTVVKAKELDVELAKKKLKVGKTQVVTVSGLLPGEMLTITVNGTVLAEAVADEDGAFEYTFAVGPLPGPQALEVVGAIPTRMGEAAFKVLNESGIGL